MKSDDFVTEVIFRKETREKAFKGEIFALFPYFIYNYTGLIYSYAHVGQHSGADYNHCIESSCPAKGNEYEDLKTELELLGYNLNVIKRRNYNKYLAAYRKANN
jgi:hypothetical protein